MLSYFVHFCCSLKIAGQLLPKLCFKDQYYLVQFSRLIPTVLTNFSYIYSDLLFVGNMLKINRSGKQYIPELILGLICGIIIATIVVIFIVWRKRGLCYGKC